MPQGAPFHVLAGLCEAVLLTLGLQDRRWLLPLPLPAMPHSDYDVVLGVGLASADVRTGSQTLILLLLGIGISLFNASHGRRFTPPTSAALPGISWAFFRIDLLRPRDAVLAGS